MANKCKQCDAEITDNVFCDDECKVRWIYQKYIVEQMGTYEMGRLINRDPKTVYKWLKDNGIPTRPRGTGHDKNPAFVFWKSGMPNPFQGRKHTAESIVKMSESSKGPSPWLRGEVNHWYGKSGAQNRNWKGGVTPERQAFCGTIEWRRAVEQVWERDKAACQHCGKHKSEYPNKRFDVHHIVGFDDSEELRACLDNLVLLCHSCHMWVHSKNNTEKKFIKEIKSNE